MTLEGATHPVDTGFLVFSKRTYPNLSALFQLLDVPVAASEMSFGVSLPDPDVEWSGTSLATLFAQKSNLTQRAFWSMAQDIVRFNRDVQRDLQEGFALGVSLGAFLDDNR